MTGQPQPRVGASYRDRSHGDQFTIVSLDDEAADLDNGQWYYLSGPEGLLAKLANGTVEELGPSTEGGIVRLDQ